MQGSQDQPHCCEASQVPSPCPSLGQALTDQALQEQTRQAFQTDSLELRRHPLHHYAASLERLAYLGLFALQNVE